MDVMTYFSVLNLQDDDEREQAVLATMMLSYGDKPCPHCGRLFTLADAKAHNMIASHGGKYAQLDNGQTHIAAHGTCFYEHEADNQWCDDHPEFATEDRDDAD